jgi:Raf kinase inhibitor-like YbhB/YbcL family protein
MPTPSVIPDPAVIHEATPTAVPELSQPTATTEEGEQAMPFAMNSRAFKHGESIPVRHSCDGEDVSPELLWTDPPTGTRSFALIMDDPDAPRGTWVHWVLFNIPAAARGLPEGVSDADEQPDGGRHGENSWGRSGYGGPCPPSGTHRYFFKLYALDRTLDLAAQASTADLEAAMQGHILAQAELMGTYAH